MLVIADIQKFKDTCYVTFFLAFALSRIHSKATAAARGSTISVNTDAKLTPHVYELLVVTPCRH